ncbi:mitochondrial 2-enoyl thioester reductase [Collariella sp. IMI 366227]|nr:mitochondrial 2-enoyl thioester reductase [Collariella sp. IMI 366227]
MASTMRLGATTPSTTAARTLLTGHRRTPSRLPSLLHPPLPTTTAPRCNTPNPTLVFSRFGEPADVLSLHKHSISPSCPMAPSSCAPSPPRQPGRREHHQGTYGAKPPFTQLLGTPEPAANGANSGVGRSAIQLGRLWGLRSINVVRERGTPEETEALKKELEELGATVVVTESEFLDRSFTARLKEEWTRGGKEPIMLGLNCVGGKSASAVVKALSPKGCMVTYGGMSRQSFPFPTGPQIFKRLRFEGFWLSEWGKENPVEKRNTVNEILELMREGKFKEAPFQEVEWNWDTEEKVLKNAVQGTLEGFRSGKGLFVFGET